ncbi:hypothetical protein E2C01_031073 [Portunus trituberculatus]|uniref:Uncharacterized protein n=1 Tax=Portunus trituberculatus TaxID=210409 RepID=A0A5B7EWM7_PORTR|nr:hypothetical protein [Portunus trituberculatus]
MFLRIAATQPLGKFLPYRVSLVRYWEAPEAACTQPGERSACQRSVRVNGNEECARWSARRHCCCSSCFFSRTAAHPARNARNAAADLLHAHTPHCASVTSTHTNCGGDKSRRSLAPYFPRTPTPTPSLATPPLNTNSPPSCMVLGGGPSPKHRSSLVQRGHPQEHSLVLPRPCLSPASVHPAQPRPAPPLLKAAREGGDGPHPHGPLAARRARLRCISEWEGEGGRKKAARHTARSPATHASPSQVSSIQTFASTDSTRLPLQKPSLKSSGPHVLSRPARCPRLGERTPVNATPVPNIRSNLYR